MFNTKTKMRALWSAVLVLSVAGSASAQSEGITEGRAWGHFEATMGFVAGQQSYDELRFARESGPADAPPAALQGAPYDRTEIFGLRYDVRLVVSNVRMTAGIDFPFTSFSADSARRNVDGGTRSVESLKSYVLRFGIGGEYPFGPVVPFVDVLGSVHWVNTTLAFNGETTEYGASAFGFSARGGVRLQVRDWFFASLAGEVGIIGPVRWGAELSVGFCVGPDD